MIEMIILVAEVWIAIVVVGAVFAGALFAFHGIGIFLAEVPAALGRLAEGIGWLVAALFWLLSYPVRKIIVWLYRRSRWSRPSPPPAQYSDAQKPVS